MAIKKIKALTNRHTGERQRQRVQQFNSFFPIVGIPKDASNIMLPLVKRLQHHEVCDMTFVCQRFRSTTGEGLSVEGIVFGNKQLIPFYIHSGGIIFKDVAVRCHLPFMIPIMWTQDGISLLWFLLYGQKQNLAIIKNADHIGHKQQASSFFA